MKVKFRDLSWKKGETKKGKNSSISKDNSELILHATKETGEILSCNIIYLVKAANNWNDLSETRIYSLEKKLSDICEFDVDENDQIIGLASLIKL